MLASRRSVWRLFCCVWQYPPATARCRYYPSILSTVGWNPPSNSVAGDGGSRGSMDRSADAVAMIQSSCHRHPNLADSEDKLPAFTSHPRLQTMAPFLGKRRPTTSGTESPQSSCTRPGYLSYPNPIDSSQQRDSG